MLLYNVHAQFIRRNFFKVEFNWVGYKEEKKSLWKFSHVFCEIKQAVDSQITK